MTKETGRFRALADLIVLAIVFWSIYSLKYFGVEHIDVLVMGSSILLVLMLLSLRGHTVKDIGISPVSTRNWLFARSLQAMAYIGLTAVLVGSVARFVFGDPSQATAISQQPDELWLFILDLTVVVWVFIAFGEEFVFRGFLLNRLLVLTGESRPAQVFASFLQAIWFGAAHSSQGLTGTLTAGTIGFVLAMLFLMPMKRNLWPLVIAHGLIDTVALTVNWMS